MRNITMNEGEKHMGTKIMYNHKAIEKKWREKWAENSVNPRAPAKCSRIIALS